MKRTIKSIVKLMSFGFIGLALLSCSKNETAPVQEKAVGFKTYTGRAVTKAGTSLIDKGTTTLLKNSQFVVYAFNTGSASWDGTVSNVFMKDVPVKYEGETGSTTDYKNEKKYTYSPLRYWPNDEESNKLSFFAYYPFNGTGIDAPTNGWDVDEGIEFTAQTNPANMVDFCVSEVAPDQSYSHTNSGTDGVVNMKFYHTLTMVKFKVKTDETDDNPYPSTTITLKSIKLKDVIVKNNLVPDSSESTENDHTKCVWLKESQNPTTSEFTVFSGTQVLSKGDEIFVPTNVEKDDAYLMIPQALKVSGEQTTTREVIATIEYEVKTGSDDAVTNTAEVKLSTAVVNNVALTEWKMNQNIVYTFVVGLKPIRFIAEVADWADVQSASFNIN